MYYLPAVVEALATDWLPRDAPPRRPSDAKGVRPPLALRGPPRFGAARGGMLGVNLTGEFGWR